MMVYHVVQIVAPGHNTSFKLGTSWLESYNSELIAEDRAAVFNAHLGDQGIGVRYAATGPHDETIPFEDLKLEI